MMDGSLLVLALLLVGFLTLGLLALAGGVDSREFDARFAPGAGHAEGD